VSAGAGGAAALAGPAAARSGGIQRNVAANVIGRVVSGLIFLAVTPVYVRMLGMEAYGLAGLATTFKTVLVAFDLGLATTLNRELARAAARGEDPDATRDLVRSIEACYWLLAGTLGMLCVALAPVAAERWLRAPTLGTYAVQEAVALIGLLLALDLPFTVYQGALLGLQRQVAANVLGVAALGVRFVGAVLVLEHVSATVRAFLAWQCLAALAATLAAGTLVWKSLPPGRRRPRIDRGELVRLWRFAAGLALVSATGVGVMHVDKLIVARLLPLDQLGYYTIATSLAVVIYHLSAAVFSAAFPRLTSAVARSDRAELAAQYHTACQLTSVIVLPVAAVLSVFGPAVVRVWTDDPVVAAQTRWLVPLLVATAAANALVTVPYALLLAFAYLRLTLAIQLAGLVLLTPTAIILSLRFGMMGAAAGWALYNLVSVGLGIRLVHRRFLEGELGEWYRRDVGPPLAVALAVAFALHHLVPLPAGRAAAAGVLALIGLVTALATASTSAWLRAWIRARWSPAASAAGIS
jgi:O-antigen/teichoic acid export membrane protein